MKRRLLIIGASGHGKVVADIAKLNGYTDIDFLDDNKSLKECNKYSVIGKVSDADELNKIQKSDFFVAIGDSKIRENIINQLESAGCIVITLIHPMAIIASGVKIGAGSVVMAGAVINPDVIVGKGCIINTSATVDHDNILADFVHVSVGTHLAGTVKVGRHTWIGIGAVLINNITICANSVIGAGAVVVHDIDLAGTYVGVPAVNIASHS